MLIDGRAEGIISKVLAILIVQDTRDQSIQTLQSTKDNHSQEADRVDNLLLGLPLILWKSHPLANDFAACGTIMRKVEPRVASSQVQ